VGDIERTRGLTQTELADVLRRAAELDAEQSLPDPVDGLDPAVVEAAAIEAGLSAQAVRRALHEVMHPDDRAPDAYTEGGLLPSRDLVLVREVPGPRSAVEEQVGRFLRRQLFERVRIFTDGSKWVPRRGWSSDFRRGFDSGGRYVFKEVSSVTVTLSPGGGDDEDDEGADTVLVRLALDLTSVRSIHRSWLASGAVSGVAVLGGAGVLVGLDPLAVAALPMAGGLTAGGHYIGKRNARREVERIHTGAAGALDLLQHPDRSPPPRSRSTRSSSSTRRSHSSSSRRTRPDPDTNEPTNEESE
jgi:hypothetical protein